MKSVTKLLSTCQNQLSYIHLFSLLHWLLTLGDHVGDDHSKGINTLLLLENVLTHIIFFVGFLSCKRVKWLLIDGPLLEYLMHFN